MTTDFLNCTLEKTVQPHCRAKRLRPVLHLGKAGLKIAQGHFPVWRTPLQLFIARISFILSSPPQRKYKVALAIGMDIIQHDCAFNNSTGRVRDTMKGKRGKLRRSRERRQRREEIP